mmetsp:Transcript_20258/g.52728  ORF Transcript_20258/g.52728 Transcript_20258/m.52728 type:complete len:225 (-) Transcript_20258:364-1038(-)
MRRPELTAFKRRVLDAHEQHPPARPHEPLEHRGVGLPIIWSDGHQPASVEGRVDERAREVAQEVARVPGQALGPALGRRNLYNVHSRQGTCHVRTVVVVARVAGNAPRLVRTIRRLEGVERRRDALDRHHVMAAPRQMGDVVALAGERHEHARAFVWQQPLFELREARVHGLAELPAPGVAQPALAPPREAVLALLAGLLQRQRGGDARGSSRQRAEHHLLARA